MIKKVDGMIRLSLVAGAVLVLAGTSGLQAGSCPWTAARGEAKAATCDASAVKGDKPAGACCAVEGAACKNGCSKAKAACTKADGDKVKAACAKEGCKATEGACKTCKAAAVKAQEKCPVMGGAINKKLYVDHGGKRIYVCCQGCIAPVEKDPAKYIKALEAEGVTLETVKAKKTS